MSGEADTETIAHLRAMLADKNAEIANMTVDLAQLREAMGGWGPVISLALTMGRKDK